ncbi:MAG: hypothetical protein IJE08_01485 [Clostridia bacterium]|nr:hypothetical protein [Clostridia bacterium]
MEKIIEKIMSTDKSLYIRYGFGWKGATWSKSTAEAIVRFIRSGNFAHYDVMEVYDGIGVSFYSANDML